MGVPPASGIFSRNSFLTQLSNSNKQTRLTHTYYITSRRYWPGGDSLNRLQAKVRGSISACVDFVQVREKDLSAAALLRLVSTFVKFRTGTATRLLVNGRVDVAVAAGADGVHLPLPELPLAGLRQQLPSLQIAGVSCHNEQEAAAAAAAGADYLLLGPVFETPSKPGVPPLGLERFARICAGSSVPVFALGGVSRANARQCVAAGAQGIAGIRLFQEEANLTQLIAEIKQL